ncbi:MAG TPA: MlaD family protein [Candidatus Wallbacteria bacterium]|nr:MlaD family protein [Candidatus Wallbacteria bacterium]
MNLSSEIKVGIVVFIGLCFLASIVFVIGDIQLFNKRYSLTVKFMHVDGLLEGAKVTFAGVKVGKVEKIDIKLGIVYVNITVSDKIEIPRCSKFMIDTAGLMGEKYLGIDLDACDADKAKGEGLYKDGDVVRGIDPLRLSKLFSEGEQIMEKVKNSVASVNKVLTDDKVLDSTKNFINNMYEVSISGKYIMASIEDRIDGIQDNIEELIRKFGDVGGVLAELIQDNKINISELIQNYKDFGAELVDIASENKKNLSELINNFKKTGENINKLIVKLDDEGNTAEKIKDILENFRKTSKNAEEVSQSINNIFKDGSVESELKGSIKSVSKMAKKADAILSSFKNSNLKLLYTFRMDKNNKKTHNDMEARLNFGGDNKTIIAGVRNIGNGNQADLQLCQDGKGVFTKRFGIIKSKVGFGVDYKWNKKSTYSVNFIDTHDTEVETISTYKIREGLAFKSKVENALKKKERNYNVGIQYAF